MRALVFAAACGVRVATSATCTWAPVNGKGHWGIGHAPDADVTLTTDYATAKQVFVSGGPNAGTQALTQGKVRVQDVQGDMAKLMASQQGGGNFAAQEAIRGITE